MTCIYLLSPPLWETYSNSRAAIWSSFWGASSQLHILIGLQVTLQVWEEEGASFHHQRESETSWQVGQQGWEQLKRGQEKRKTVKKTELDILHKKKLRTIFQSATVLYIGKCDKSSDSLWVDCFVKVRWCHKNPLIFFPQMLFAKK